MKTIGIFQLEQKTYETLQFDEEFEPSVGRIPKNFHMTIYGDSGEGKTEFAIRIAKQFCKQELLVDWISYEQGHGYDLQQACRRNDMIKYTKIFSISNPHEEKDDNVSYFEDFENKVKKRGSADVFVIDSTLFSDFTVKDFEYLFKKYTKKGFIWISHKDGKLPEGALAKKVAKLGGITFLVKNYIAEPIKNRFGGNKKYVVYELRARLLEPKFFAELDAEVEKAKQKALKIAENINEEVGVDADE